MIKLEVKTKAQKKFDADYQTNPATILLLEASTFFFFLNFTHLLKNFT